MEFDKINQNSIKNFDVIEKNILKISNQFVKTYYSEINNKINKNQILYARFDIVVDSSFRPYIIEVNASGPGNSQCDKPTRNFFNECLNNYIDPYFFKDQICSNISKHKSKVYILGGFGTFAGIDISYKTVKNYSEITDIVNDSDNIPFILDSESNESTLNETKISTYNNFINGMIRAENYCASNNISHLIMGIACDTMHLCLEDYKIHNNITFVNMIDCVCNKVNQIYRNYEKIYLLSAYETFTSNIYHNKLECSIEKDIKLFPLVKELYTKIKKGIVLNKVICNNIITLIPNNSLVILGCTELPVNLDIFNKCCSKKKIDFIDCNNELAKQLSLKFKEFSSK